MRYPSKTKMIAALVELVDDWELCDLVEYVKTTITNNSNKATLDTVKREYYNYIEGR